MQTLFIHVSCTIMIILLTFILNFQYHAKNYHYFHYKFRDKYYQMLLVNMNKDKTKYIDR
jgi:hypothetical protein